MNLEETVNLLLETGRQATQIVDLGGGRQGVVSGQALNVFPLPPSPRRITLRLATLRSIVDYGLALAAEEPVFLHVSSPASVVLWGRETGADKYIPELAQAVHCTEGVPFGDLRQFRCRVLALFEESPDRDRLLADTAAFQFKDATIRRETVNGLGFETSDVRDRLGGAMHAVTDPVYTLRPRWTFPETGHSPVGPFLCSVSGGEGETTDVQLDWVGGDAWRVEATRAVGEYLEKLLNERDDGTAAPLPVYY